MPCRFQQGFTRRPIISKRQPRRSLLGAGKCQACHAPEHESLTDRTAHSQAWPTWTWRPNLPMGNSKIGRRSGRTAFTAMATRSATKNRSRPRPAGKYVLADLPIRYVIGSGRFSRSYLIERDGFLYESPATWYAARPGWGLSPGYDDTTRGLSVGSNCGACGVMWGASSRSTRVRNG